MLNFDLPPVKVAGYFTISTDQRGVLAEFPNLITNDGISAMYNSGYLIYCFVGTGNTPPVVTNTALANRIAATSSTYSSSTINTITSTPPYYAEITKYYEFATGTAAGNLSEVGVGWFISSPSNYGLFSRALILDAEGLPTTITVLPSEVLRVTYTLRLYIPTEDATGTITLGGNVGGTTHNWIMRAARCTDGNYWRAGELMAINAVYRPYPNYPSNPRVFAYSSDIASITGSPSGISRGCTGPEGTYYYALWGTETGPLSIRSLLVTAFSGAAYQIQFDPPINKTSLQIFKCGFNHSWGRYVEP